MISDLLKTCYARSLLIARPETEIAPSMDNSTCVDDDQLSTAPSFSSKITCFSQRLGALNRPPSVALKTEEKFKAAVGRGRAIDPRTLYRDPVGSRENISDDETDGTISNDRVPSPAPSVANTGASFPLRFYRSRQRHHRFFFQLRRQSSDADDALLCNISLQFVDVAKKEIRCVEQLISLR